MKLIYIIAITILLLFTSCLKKIESEANHDNFFDPLYEHELWFEQDGIDSVHIGGSVYRYVLTYKITHPVLLDPSINYGIGVKRNDSGIYGSTSHTGDKFSFSMFSKHRVDGVFCHDLCIKGEGGGYILASFYDCFEE